MLGQPLWCSIADRLARPKAVILTSLALGAGGVVSLALMHHFEELALLIGGAALAGAGVNPLLDSSTMETLRRNGVPLSDYGRFRVWGGFGWGAAALAIGPTLDHLGILWLFWDYAIASGVFFLLLAGYNMQTDASLRRRPAPEPLGPPECNTPALDTPAARNLAIQVKDASADESMGAATPLLGRPLMAVPDLTTRQYLAALFGRPGVPLFFLLIICMGVAKGTVDTFLFLFLQDLGASSTLLGVTLAVTVVSGKPCIPPRSRDQALYCRHTCAPDGRDAVFHLLGENDIPHGCQRRGLVGAPCLRRTPRLVQLHHQPVDRDAS
jgi:MFS family permease